jgi:hypothetical protein
MKICNHYSQTMVASRQRQSLPIVKPDGHEDLDLSKWKMAQKPQSKR